MKLEIMIKLFKNEATVVYLTEINDHILKEWQKTILRVIQFLQKKSLMFKSTQKYFAKNNIRPTTKYIIKQIMVCFMLYNQTKKNIINGLPAIYKV